ncbi:hypothetical protein MXB_4750, partial [Myxobolus squamalis]
KLSYREIESLFNPAYPLRQIFKEHLTEKSIFLKDQDFIKNSSLLARLIDLSHYAIDKGVKLIVDAEQSWLQPSISFFTLLLMTKFNKSCHRITNTYQCYLKNSRQSLELDMQFALDSGVSFPIKIVRGAYITQELEFSNTQNRKYPIYSKYMDTSTNFDACVKDVLDKIGENKPKITSTLTIISHLVRLWKPLTILFVDLKKTLALCKETLIT